jgi:anti-sigma B factor antagonist
MFAEAWCPLNFAEALIALVSGKNKGKSDTGANAGQAEENVASTADLWHKRWVMDIAVRTSGSTSIVDLDGDITLRTTPELRKVLLGQFREKRAQRVVVNMTGVRYIDSAGVASLVEALRLARDLKRQFALFGLGKIARQVLELTRLTKVFEIHETEPEALGAEPAGT